MVRLSARRAWLRWAAVGAGIGILCGLPVVIGRLPVSAPRVDPDVLRSRILAARVPYAGYAESDGSLGLPDLPGIDDVSSLLGSRTHLRMWSGPTGSRVDVISPTGERGLYTDARGITTWDYERFRTTRLYGAAGLRLPRSSDLTPPALAVRLLGGPQGAETLRPLPARRVAGVAAAGLEVIPADPDTTVGAVRVWADPRTGLAVAVEVVGRGLGAPPSLRTAFLDLDQGADAVPPGVLVPPYPAAGQRVAAPAVAVGDAIDRYATAPLPDTLIGRGASGLIERRRGLRSYGLGFSTFGVVAVPPDVVARIVDAARKAGGTSVEVAGGDAVALSTDLLDLVAVDSPSGGFLLAGPVRTALLADAARELVAGS